MSTDNQVELQDSGGKMKRYSIVKVNNHCPSRFVDNVRNEYVCKIKQARDGYHLNCVGCRYGDTKEQLIRKVAQALELCMKKGYRTITSEEYAKFIVEFLGVE